MTAHILEQTDHDGLPIIINNQIMQRHLNALHSFIQTGDKMLFLALKRSLDQKLLKVGVLPLPEV